MLEPSRLAPTKVTWSSDFGMVFNMKLRTFFGLFFIFLLGMAGVNLVVGLEMDKAQEKLKATQGQLHHLKELAEDFIISSQWETRFARGYLATKDPKRREWYDQVDAIMEGKIPRPENYNLEYWDLVTAGFEKVPAFRNEEPLSLENHFLHHEVTAEEVAQIKDAHSLYAKVSRTERIAMNAAEGVFDDGTGSFLKRGKPDPALAHKLLYSDEYSKINGELSLKIAQLVKSIENRYAIRIKNDENFADQLIAINSYLNVALFVLVVSSLIFLRLRWSKRTSQLMEVVGGMSHGDLSKRAPVWGNDEIGELATTINSMANNLCGAFEKLEEKVKLSEVTLAELEVERRRSEKLLHNILPAAIAERLRGGEENIAEIHPEVTVFFSDIVGFTELSAKLGPTETVQLLNEIFGKFDELVEKHNVEKIKTIGDSYMVVGGVPNRDSLHCQHVAEFAIEAERFLEEFSKGLRYPLHMRIGIHTGTVAAGVVGKKRFSYDLWGDVVNVASRYETTSQPDKIHVSEAVKVRLDDDYLFMDGGVVELKGKGTVKSYYLMGKKSEMPQVIEFRSPSSAS